MDPIPPRLPLTRVFLLLLCLLAGLSTAAAQAAKETPKRPLNVLFIASDDLNHWVRHLNRNKQSITPNIDRLASQGVTFTNAYCAAPLCNPSRAALMSGLRPSTTGVYDNNQDWRPHVPQELTLTTHFRTHGYYVAGAGKIYHGGFDRRPEWDDYMTREGGDPRPTSADRGVGGIQFAPLDCQDEEMADYRIASTTSRSSSPAASTSHTCRGTCRVSTTICTRWTRSSCPRRRRTTWPTCPRPA